MALFVSLGAALAEDCVAPGASPEIPDGATATTEEMIAGSQAVRTFQADTEAYLDCLTAKDAELEAIQPAGEEGKAIAAKRQALIENHNAAVDELNRVANAFNQAVRDYKARQPKDE
ncbi:MAG: hypothetical protein D6763_06405 [Alphaproteobacteria bacterium]|nr:MAG: hypothetical protein D6763_06405 [Alphaproteobacteria bacterium]